MLQSQLDCLVTAHAVELETVSASFKKQIIILKDKLEETKKNMWSFKNNWDKRLETVKSLQKDNKSLKSKLTLRADHMPSS